MAESNNKYRLSKLLTDGGTYFAKELLKVEFSNLGFTDINTFLNDAAVKRKLKSLHSRKVLHQSQMDLLYPSSGPANIDDLDITLLTCILTNCFKLSASKQTTITDLRTLRNELFGHTASYQLDDNDFKQQWQKVASFLESESNTYLSPACVRHVTDMRKTIECEILTQEAAEKYYHELRVFLEEKTRLSEERELQNEVKLHRMGADMSNLKSNMEVMAKNFNHMVKEVRSYRYQILQLSWKGISSKHKNEGSKGFEGEISAEETELLYIDLDQQFIEAKIVEATAKIGEVKLYESEANDIGELVYKKRIDVFIQTLKRNRVLVLVGLPGSGKTFTALSIMSEMCDENVKPVMVGKLGDLKKVLDPMQNLFILADDIFGHFSLDSAVVNELNHIADPLLEHTRLFNSYFIFTMRHSIYQSAKSNHICDTILKHDTVIDDKIIVEENLLQFYARRKNITLSKMQQEAIHATQQFAIGFPVLCSHMDGTFETIVELFRSPSHFIEQEIRALSENDSPEYIVLLLTLLHGNKLKIHNIDIHKLDAIRSSHTFAGEGNEIQSIVNSLIGTFLGRVIDKISFIHDCVLESTLKIGIQASRDILISHLPFEYIKELYSILKSENSHPNKDMSTEIFPSLMQKRGKEFLKEENSATFLIGELAEYHANAEELEHIVRPVLKFSQLYSNGKNILHMAAASGKVEAIIYILQFKQKLIKTSDDKGWNALHYAAESGSVASIDFLIESDTARMGDQNATDLLPYSLNPETRTANGENILHIAAEKGNTEMVKYISYKYKCLVRVTNEQGWNALHYASKRADTAMIESLITSGLDPEATTLNGKNILHLAAIYGNVEVVRYLTENYKDLIHTVDNVGWNALHCASQKQSIFVVKMLIEAGLNPETKTADGLNILHFAASNGNMEVVRYIIENYKGLIHTVDNDGWNALHSASQKQNANLLEVLIEAGLKPETRKTDGSIILHIAASNGNLEVVRYVTENYKDLIHTVDNNGFNALHNASVQRYITENYKDLIHTVDNDGWNALHYASQELSIQMINVLIEAGLKPETRTTHGANILHIAARNGNMEVVRYITENYTDLIHTVDYNGCNALHYASEEQSSQIIELLIEAGLKPETRFASGGNILHIAAYNGNMEVVRYITENYKDLIDTVAENGLNALHLASCEQNITLLKVLIEAGLKPETTGTNGINILHFAARNGNMEVVRYITENYKDLIHTVDNDGGNALHCAAYGGSVEMVKLLIEAGCDPYTTISDISNVLHLLAYHKDFDTVHCILKGNPRYKTLHLSQEYLDFFIKSGTNGEIRTKDGGNILHVAASNGNYEAVKYICVNYNSLIKTVNMNGWNALCYSSVRSSVEQFEYLISKGEEPRDTVDGENVLLLAAFNGNLPIVEYIGEHLPGLLKTSDIKGANALHCAASNGSIDIFSYLVSLGEDVWKETKENKNVLHIAIENDRLEMVRYIAQHYSDMLTSRGRDGWTCLHHAAKYSSVGIIEYLKHAGLCTEEETLDGRNILDIAVEFGNIDLIMYIKEKGWF